jgi:Flp pilus assembly protein CpaB
MKIRIIGAVVAIVFAVIGTFLLVNYVRTADIRAAEGAEFVNAYIVETEVPAGTAAADITKYISVKEIPALAAISDRVTSLNELEGLQTDVSLVPGEQLILSRWIDPTEIGSRGEAELPAGMQSLTIALPVERVVGGSVRAGDTVGVIVSSEAETAEGKTVLLTKQVFHKVLVLSVQGGTSIVRDPGESSDGGATASDPVDSLMVTVALTTPDVEVMVWSQQWGVVWLTLEPEPADESGGRTVDGTVIYQ